MSVGRTQSGLFYVKPRKFQNESKIPFKMQMPLALRNRVAGKGSRVGEHGCLWEISLVFTCLSQNNFEDKLCTKEVNNFHQCYETYLSNKKFTKEQALKGILTPNAKTLRSNQINILLKKYPQV